MPTLFYDANGTQTGSSGAASTGSSSSSGGPTGSRCILSLGGYANTSTNNAYWTTTFTKANNTSGGTVNINTEAFFKAPYPFKVTGWEMLQYVANGTNSFQLCKNRTSSLNNIYTVTAGNATVNGFPGNSFSGAVTDGPSFAAGDTISAVVAFSSGSSTNMDLQLTIEWL